MGMDFQERLRNDCLTSIEDYRRMQLQLHAMKKDAGYSDQCDAASEEWKKWELAPLDSPVNPVVEKESKSLEPSSRATQGVHKALRTLDKY